MLKQVGFTGTLHNTCLSDQDEMKLRHAPCPGQGRNADLCFLDAMGICFFLGVSSGFHSARRQLFGSCTSNQTVGVCFRCACFMFEIQSCQATKIQIAIMPCSLRSTALRFAASFDRHSKQRCLAIQCGGKKEVLTSEPITTQTCRKAIEKHSKKLFPQGRDANFSWTNGPPTNAPKHAPKNVPKNAPKNAPNIHSENSLHLFAVSRQKIGRNFWRILGAVFHPIGLSAWPT